MDRVAGQGRARYGNALYEDLKKFTSQFREPRTITLLARIEVGGIVRASRLNADRQQSIR